MKKLLTILTGLLLGANLAYGLVTEKTNSVSLVLADTCDGTFNDFKFQLSGYNYNVFKFMFDVNLTGVDCVFRITKPIEGTIYLDVAFTEITVSTTNVTFAISQTNLPPPGTYYGELLSYQTGTTNYYRSLAQGKLPITWSLYLNDTNYFQRYITNAVVGYVYVHPSWVAPYWITTNSSSAMSNYFETRVDTLDVNTGFLNTAIGSLQSATGSLNGAVSALQTSTNYLNTRANNLEAATNSLNTRAGSLESATNALNARTTSIEASTNYLNTRAGNLEAATNALDNRADSLEGATNSLNTRASNLEASTNNLNARILITETNALLLTGARAMQGNLNMGNNSITNVATNSFVFQDGVSISSAKIQIYDTLDESTNALNTRMINAEGSTNALNTRAGNLEAATNALQVQATALQGATNTLNTATNTLQVQATALQGATNTLNNRMINAEGSTNALNTRMGNVEGATNSLNSNKLNLSGGTMTGGLTNEFGFYGNGMGLTNMSAFGDVYKASNNIFGNTTTQVLYAVESTNMSLGAAYYCRQNAYNWGLPLVIAQTDVGTEIDKMSIISIGIAGGDTTGIRFEKHAASGNPETNVMAAIRVADDGRWGGYNGILKLYAGANHGNYGTRVLTNLLSLVGGTGFVGVAIDPIAKLDVNGNMLVRDELVVSNTVTAQGTNLGYAIVVLNSSTTTLNTAVGNLNSSTATLNTAVANLNIATNLLNSATGSLNTAVSARMFRAGDIMTGPLTNTAGFYGNGVGLTNLAAPSATNSDALGNIAAALWVSSTQDLNTAVAKLNANAITNPVGANVNFNTYAATNIGALGATSLQITGGSPTNKAIFYTTNSLGQGVWWSPVEIEVEKTTASAFPVGNTKISFNATNSLIGGSFDGGNWTPGVGRIEGVLFFSSGDQVATPATGYMRGRLYLNGSVYLIGPRFNHPTDSQYGATEMSFAFRNTNATNIYSFWWDNSTDITVTNSTLAGIIPRVSARVVP